MSVNSALRTLYIVSARCTLDIDVSGNTVLFTQAGVDRRNKECDNWKEVKKQYTKKNVYTASGSGCDGLELEWSEAPLMQFQGQRDSAL